MNRGDLIHVRPPTPAPAGSRFLTGIIISRNGTTHPSLVILWRDGTITEEDHRRIEPWYDAVSP